ncbi:class F sortase [Streptomyces sp. NRRL F-5135]|uniref:class F sortase n=1 Tax=Streptomyces sp. NRRL F-5135 TaxID=1463858 RepID=UPI00068E5A2C|nr:class F sortase [Streptomyces sp. NRRL F-5135]
MAGAVLLLALGLASRDAGVGPMAVVASPVTSGSSPATSGSWPVTSGFSPAASGVAAVSPRPGTPPLPPPHAPLPAARPLRVAVPALGVAAPVEARGLDRAGAVDPPPYARPGAVGWYGDGVAPGAEGVALFVGHVDTDTGPAVFYGLSGARPGGRIRVTRADGSLAEFTIEDVRVVPRDRFDAHEVYGPRVASRAELRLITCGGTFDRKANAYTANVVVSAYLTGVRAPRDG